MSRAGAAAHRTIRHGSLYTAKVSQPLAAKLGTEVHYLSLLQFTYAQKIRVQAFHPMAEELGNRNG